MRATGPRLVVLGRQGAGKGTQCVRLASRLGIPHVSTGDLFRAEIERGTSLGGEIAALVADGELVPDEVVLDVVARHLGRGRREAGYLLDGFPRTTAQAQALFEVLGADAVQLALEIDVPRQVVIDRLAARRVCVPCGTVGSAGDGLTPRCRDCGAPMTARPDDRQDAIVRRLDLYDEQSGPLLELLDERGLLRRVDGVGDPDDVHRRVMAVVVGHLPVPPTPRGAPVDGR